MAKISKLISPWDEQKLKRKILSEYAAADNYTRSWKEDTKDLAAKYLLPKPKEDKVKVRKVLNNLTIRLATFISDEIQVTSVPKGWILWAEVASNCNKVFESNFRSMNIKDKYREALIDDWITWVWCLTVSWWNDHKQEPIISYIDSRLTFPDPKNWTGNKMRFFWTKLRKNTYELEADDAYDQNRLKEVELEMDVEIEDTYRYDNQQKNFTDNTYNDWLTDLYNHLTVFKEEWDKKPHLYLVTLWANQSIVVRLIKMRALTDWEIADSSEIDFWVELFRAKPIKWSYAWVSIIDDVWQFQDIQTLLTNLQIEQAKLAAVWGKTFINDWLWIDIDDLANNSWPWDIIPFSSIDPNLNANNWIMHEPTRPVNPITSNVMWEIEQLSQLADPSGSSLVQWQSLSWTQTKAEVQTLQQNINQVLSYMASNYMDSLRWLWESIYRSYAANMSPQRKKDIVIVDDNWKTDSYWFKKNEFISKWDAYIVIKSRSQEDIKKKQDFAVLLSVVWVLKQSVTPWSTQDVVIDRLLIDKSSIRWLDAKTIHPYTADERKAYANLDMLNRDIELTTKPKTWEDHNVFINIYKTGLDTDARESAILEREMMIYNEPTAPEVPMEWGGWNSVAWLWASMIASEQAQWVNPSIWDV